MTCAITIGICDDHTLVRSGLRRVIEAESDMSVTWEAGSAEDALSLVSGQAPDVLLLDVTLPGRSGIDVLPQLLDAAPWMKVVGLSMHDDSAYVAEAFAAGANGYLVKDAADAELVKALHEVRAGHRYLQPALGARLASSETTSAKEPGDPLTEREHEVLRLLALGHTNQEVAAALFVSVRTAETHRARIVEKLGLKTRAQLVRYALDSGALDLEAAFPRG
jgi:DNA-binding NarL/FixJ family response regulator